MLSQPVPTSALVGGPLALIETGDMIEMDIPNRVLRVDLTDEVLAARRAKWIAPEPRYERG